jgi:hypothetical protein
VQKEEGMFQNKQGDQYDKEEKEAIASQDWLTLLHDKLKEEGAPKVSAKSPDGQGVDSISPTFIGTKKSVRLTNERTGIYIELTNEEAFDWVRRIVDGGHIRKPAQA